MRKLHVSLTLLILFTGLLWGGDFALEKLYPEIPLIGVPPSDVVWSPDEQLCAFLWNSESERTKNLYNFSPESGENPRQLTFFKKDGVSEFCWGRGSEEIFYLKGTSVYSLNVNDLSVREMWEDKIRIRALSLSPDAAYLSYLQGRNLWIRHFESGSVSQLTEFDPAHEGIGRYAWSPDSTRILFYFQDFAGVRQVGIPQFGREEVQIRNVPRPFPGDPPNRGKIGFVDIPRGQISWVPLEFENLISYSWSPSAKKILLEESTEFAGKRCIYVCDAKNPAAEEVISEESPLFTFSWLWSSQWLDDDRIILTSDRSGFCHLYSLDLRSKNLEQLTSGEWEVLDFFIPGGGEIYCIANRSRPENRDLYRVLPRGRRSSGSAGKMGCTGPIFPDPGRTCVFFFPMT